MPKVSVIVPVYDSEPWLRECLDSIVGQTLSDIEVICVDDGSSDGSAAILAEYAARDSRVRVLTQANAGAGPARNAGMAVATGEWLSFLDSDDVFGGTMLSEMAAAGDCESADVVACAKDAGGDVFRRWRGWAWDKLFRRAFIERHGLLFQSLPVANDLFFTYSALTLAGGIAVVGKTFVRHRSRAGSVETTRDRAPLAPICAVRALYDRIGMADGFARWVPEFLFWHINRLKTVEASDALYRETERFGRELGIRLTRKWAWEEAKHAVKRLLRRARPQ